VLLPDPLLLLLILSLLDLVLMLSLLLLHQLSRLSPPPSSELLFPASESLPELLIPLLLVLLGLLLCQWHLLCHLPVLYQLFLPASASDAVLPDDAALDLYRRLQICSCRHPHHLC
jgi:hypothetical protein